MTNADHIKPKQETYVKIRFDLNIDEDGYPPVGSETLNAIVLENGYFCIDNTPFFIERIALGDVVKADIISGTLDKFVFKNVVSFSGNRSLSVIFSEDIGADGIKDKLSSMGCYCEYGEFNNGSLKMLAVSVPNQTLYGHVMAILLQMQNDDFLSVAELACF